MKTAVVGTAVKDRDLAPQPVFGIVKSTYARLNASKPAVNDEDFSGAAELDAWARRAFAANGFGDANVAAPAAAAGPGAIEVHADALKFRSASFWAICFAIGEALGTALDRTVTRWREQRDLRRTYRALCNLDARTLKDIGFGQHEAGSIAAELAGRAERTRMQALRSLRELSI